MVISASIRNSYHQHEVSVSTDGTKKQITFPPKANGYGSAINGGELLFLSLATCFCNDSYREAVKRKMSLHSVHVTVTGHFGEEGQPATHIHYEVSVLAPEHSQKEIQDLIRHVDQIAEIHNTLRRGIDVVLKTD